MDDSWLGTRLEVELPVSKEFGASAIKKSIVPEIINQRFMWVDDYFHYDDWRGKQKEVFDNFNLLVVPQSKDAEKYFFDKDAHCRRIPQGVFPFPNHKRQLMLPTANQSVVDALKNPNHDEYVLYEKEPFKMMVINELKKSETLKPIDEDTSMITNLQNLKQGLKSDYSDKELLNTILLNLNFTDSLIEEHLRGSAKKDAPKYVPRDAEKFRNFIESTYDSKDREDPFTHFYLKEARNRVAAEKEIADEKARQSVTEEGSADVDLLERGEKRRQVLQDKLEETLMASEMRDNDLLDLSSSLKSRVNVKVNIGSLMKSEFVHDVDPDLANANLTPEEFLEVYRRRAETKLIKTKIIYKLYNSEGQLTPNEKQYLKQWVTEV